MCVNASHWVMNALAEMCTFPIFVLIYSPIVGRGSGGRPVLVRMSILDSVVGIYHHIFCKFWSLHSMRKPMYKAISGV